MTQAPMLRYPFDGRVAVVTGAASGMGAAAAVRFAGSGAHVVLADVDEAGLAAVVAGITAAGGSVAQQYCDVSDEDDVESLIATAVDRFGSVDFAFNCAGIQIPAGDIAHQPVENFDRVTSVNFRGVWSCMKHELQVMGDQITGGAIVNCASVGGLVGFPGLGAYVGTKHGVIGLTATAALEYASRGVRVNAICPGTIRTPMVSRMLDKGELSLEATLAGLPLGRLGTAEECAAAAVWLCSDEASFITGVSLPVDGGFVAH